MSANMNTKFRIVVSGVGGVGGYYGARLSSFYEKSDNIEVSFLARGEHVSEIRRNGLTLLVGDTVTKGNPKHVADDPKDLGVPDLILFCCKAYDLEGLAYKWLRNVSEDTLLLPLLNGVDNADRLQVALPQARSLNGCAYLFSKLVSPGIVRTMGTPTLLEFGHSSIPDDDLIAIQKIFNQAGIGAETHRDMVSRVWKKFSFVSPLACVTSAFDYTVGRLLEDPNAFSLLRSLMVELLTVAEAHGVHLSGDCVETNLSKVAKLPSGATTSMHEDFKAGKRTEIEALVGYVVRSASGAGLDVPSYARMFDQLSGQGRQRPVA